MTQAATGYFGVAAESTPGVAEAPTHFIPVNSVNFPVNQDQIESKEIRGTRQNLRRFDGPLTSDGTFTSPFYPAGGVGVILRAAIGDSTSAAEAGVAGGVRHTFVDAFRLPSLTMERSDGFGDEEFVLAERLFGAKVESFKVSAAFGEMVNLDVSLQATDRPSNPTPLDRADVTFPTIEPLTFIGAVIQIDGVENDLFKTINLEINNTLERQNTLRKKRTARFISEGSVTVNLSGSMEFDDLDMYNRFVNADVFSVKLIFESDSIIAGTTHYQAIFTMPTVKVLKHDTPFQAEGIVNADIDFNVRNDTGTMIQVELLNMDAIDSYKPAP